MGEKKNLPSHRIFVVRNYEKDGEEKASWTEIGVMFQNRLGFSLQLQANPIDGRCVALPYEERPFEKMGDKMGDKASDSKGESAANASGEAATSSSSASSTSPASSMPPVASPANGSSAKSRSKAAG